MTDQMLADQMLAAYEAGQHSTALAAYKGLVERTSRGRFAEPIRWGAAHERAWGALRALDDDGCRAAPDPGE